MRTRISVAVAVLLGCCLLAPHAKGSIAARIHAATRSQKPASKVTDQQQPVEVALRPTPKPGTINVADWLSGSDKLAAGRISRGQRSSKRRSRPTNRQPLKAPKTLEPVTRANPLPRQEKPLVDPVQDPGQKGETPQTNENETGKQQTTEKDASNSSEPSLQSVPQEEPKGETKPADSSVAEPAKAPAKVDPPASKPTKKFSSRMIRLRDRIRYCLAYYYQRPPNASERSPWGIMHSLISYGVDTEIIVGRQRVNAIGWLCWNRPCRGMQLLYMDGDHIATRSGPGYEGHEGQLLSMLALSKVKRDYPMRVGENELTVEDLIEYEKRTCRPASELTFKLISLSHYLESDATWTSKWGVEWDIPRLIREELSQPVVGACCGGTHRLIGFSMAVKTREKRSEPMDGQWLRAKNFVSAYHKHAIKLQNRDGSFSTSWLKRRDASGDMDRRIQTTGHILEWLVFSLPEDELTDPRIVRSVNYLSSLLLNNRNHEWEIGPQGHALRALALYNERVFGDEPGERRASLARRPRK